MSDQKHRCELAFIEVLTHDMAARGFAGLQFVAGSDRETVAEDTRVSVQCSHEPVSNCDGLMVTVSVLLVTPDALPRADRLALASALEAVLRAHAADRIYSPAGDITIAGYDFDSVADASANQVNGDVFKLTAGLVLGDA